MLPKSKKTLAVVALRIKTRIPVIVLEILATQAFELCQVQAVRQRLDSTRCYHCK